MAQSFPDPLQEVAGDTTGRSGPLSAESVKSQFNAAWKLDPLLEFSQTQPDLLAESAWIGHIPFAFWVVAAHRPRVIVELGTHRGTSYGAFCQAVEQLGLEAACYAVDTWEGDEQAGFYGIDVYDEFCHYHDSRYGAFSRLIRSTFDTALSHFPDGSIDLLHIDGFHEYGAVKHDFQAWLPKLSTRGIVLFHDINVRERDFGAWRFWNEVTEHRLHFTFLHSHGLGVLAVGSELSEPMRGLLAAKDKPDTAVLIRNWFAAAGHRREVEFELGQIRHILQDRTKHEAKLAESIARLEDISAEKCRLEEKLIDQGVDVVRLKASITVAERRALETGEELQRSINERELALAEIQKLHADNTKLLSAREALSRQLNTERRRRRQLRRSFSWRATKPLRLIGNLFKQLSRAPKKKRISNAPAHLPNAVLVENNVVVQSSPPSPLAMIRLLRLELDQALDQQGPRFSLSPDAASNLPWLSPRRQSQFLALRNAPVNSGIAVVAHVYYRDLWPELSTAISNLDEPFDLFVTLTSPNAEDLGNQILLQWPRAHVLIVDNHGRDILPFLSLLRTNVLFRYELICKVHTKRSHWHQNGEAWRKDLINGVLGSSTIAREIQAAFEQHSNLGMVVADGHVYTGRELWEGNRRHLTRLLPYLGMDERQFSKSFAGGSMFWARPAFLRLISNLPFRLDDFEVEPIGNDGAMVHAIERLISLACFEAGLTIKEAGQISLRGKLQDHGVD